VNLIERTWQNSQDQSSAVLKVQLLFVTAKSLFLANCSENILNWYLVVLKLLEKVCGETWEQQCSDMHKTCRVSLLGDCRFYTMDTLQFCCCLMSACLSLQVNRACLADCTPFFFHQNFSLMDTFVFFSFCLWPVPLLALPSTAVSPTDDNAWEVESLPQLLAALGISLIVVLSAQTELW